MKFRLFVTLALFVVLCTPYQAWAKIPNDPFAQQQWGWRDVRAYEAWDIATGSRDVIVAIIDNGFDTFHQDLMNNVWRNTDEISDNGIDDDQNGYVDDVWGWNFVAEDVNGDGVIDEKERRGNNDPRPGFSSVTPEEIQKGVMHHGTVVAGIIGAVGDNNFLGAGINWQVRLMNIKVIGNSGSATGIPFDKAIRYAVDNGAHVINFSLVTGVYDDNMRAAIRYAYDRGVVMIAAAGNSLMDLNQDRMYPVCVDAEQGIQMVLGVSAINEERRLAAFSNVGSSCIDITAPGVGISSTERFSPTAGLTAHYGGGWNGTSFAAPFVSAAAALIKHVQPTWAPAQIYDTLLTTTHKTPPKDEAEYANLFGRGLLQIDRALAKAAAAPGAFFSSSRVSDAPGVVIYERGTGYVDARRVTGSVVRTSTVLSIAHADQVLPWHDGTNKGYVVIKKNTVRDSRVEIYDASWAYRDGWVLPMPHIGAALIADVDLSSGPELIVAPRTGSTELFRVFSLQGKEIFRKIVPTKRTVTALAEGAVEQNGTHRIAFLAQEEKVMVLTDTAPQRGFERRFVLSGIPARNSLAVGDITGDGVLEYVIASGSGADPFVYYLTEQGIELRKFYAYDPSYRGGMGLLVTPAGDNRPAEVVTIPYRISQGVRVWNNRSHVLAEWTPYDSIATSSVWGVLGLLP